MQIEAFFARYELEGQLGVLPQGLGIAGRPGIISGGHNAAASSSTFLYLEAAHVVPLPAMQRERGVGQGFHGGLGVHAYSGVPRLCSGV